MKISKNLIATLMLSVPLFCMVGADSGQELEKEIATVSYCDLLRNPAKYDKATVCLTALYTRGFEISALDDPKCDSQKSTWVELDPASKQCTKANIQKEYDRVFYPPRKKRKGVIKMNV